MKTILVTGSNKGIGYGIVETLLEKDNPNYNIILSSRNPSLGQSSYKFLLSKFPSSSNRFFYHQLDISSSESIQSLISFLKTNFNGLDYLVNNAGIGTHGITDSFPIVNDVLNANVYSTINFTQTLIEQKILKSKGKIILLGSMLGNLNYLKSEKLKEEFKETKEFDGLLKLADRYKKCFIDGELEKNGWCKNAYWVSKMIVNSYARVLSLNKYIIDNDISVYAAHPGYVNTDMTDHKGPLTVKEGAKNEVFLIDLPEGIIKEYQGKYFDNCKVGKFE